MRIVREEQPSDLSTRARIRNAAIEEFAIRGFGASVREIAARAGVTAGLITHHFGSKDNLRAECDAEVIRLYRTIKGGGAAMSPAQSMAVLAELDEYAPMFVYILRSVRDGGEAGIQFLEQMIQEAITFSAEGEKSGLVRPSRDPEARARYLVTSSLGGILLQLSLHPQLDLADVRVTFRRIVEEISLSALELYTEGVLTDRRYLDEYLLYVGDPPGTAETSTMTTPQTLEHTP
ncbi:MAG TPA: TetR family transcriptional regulator [Terrimesophilobacter sp.]|nr:TetR family transcriptional regulator [Terrimesophilobacter sp.]